MKEDFPHALDSWAIGILLYKILASKNVLAQINIEAMTMRR
jgi:hypothetical protein